MTESKVLVLDGAAGSYLEAMNVPLHPKLWSSGALMNKEGQMAIRDLHRAYLDAGADVITSVTYQASVAGFQEAGLSEKDSYNLIKLGISLAQEEAKLYGPDKLVAAGFGPYGAYLCEGQEYTGDYKSIHKSTLRDFWLPRINAALEKRPDYILFETIPNLDELEVIVNDLTPLCKAQGIPVWVSLSIKIEEGDVKLADGTDLHELTDMVDRISLIGANCFDAHRINLILGKFQQLKMPLIFYPNHGEVYDGITKTWTRSDTVECFNSDMIRNMIECGTLVIGGCCNTTPDTIRIINKAVQEQKEKKC